jgi:hypothetical protein
MAVYLSNLTEAYGPLLSSHWEKKELPQHYDEMTTQWVHPTPQRHMLGIVGGNEVSQIQGNRVDLESDLKGIHIPNTFCPSRQYQPLKKNQTEIARDNVKGAVKIDIQPVHLPAYQMMAYPSVVAPVPMVNEVCRRPEKY